MHILRERRLARLIAVFLLLNFISSTLVIPSAFALTSGPSQPEFSVFEPAGIDGMVDEFTGDLTYTLPLLEVPGPHGSSYPLTLSYHSGLAPEQEASWVGYGWSLNPGAINRNKQGLPDDYNGEEITYHNKMPKNWTVSAGFGAGFELFSKDEGGGGEPEKVGAGITLNASTALRYNNYRGYGISSTFGMGLSGVVSLSRNIDGGQGSFLLSVNPMGIYDRAKNKSILTKNQISQSGNRRESFKEAFNKGSNSRKINSLRNGIRRANVSFLGSNYSAFTRNNEVTPSIIGGYTGKTTNYSVGTLITPSFLPLGISPNLFGKYSTQEYQPAEQVNAYGYMYSANAKDNFVMDYHIENDAGFQKRDAYLGVPFNGADMFSISGQGIGGGFRLHHKELGTYGPKPVSSKTDIYNIGGEIELGANWGVGADLGVGEHTLSVKKEWYPDLFAFFGGPVYNRFLGPNSPKTDEPVFFRFNNDLGGSWTHPTGDEPIQANLRKNLLVNFLGSKGFDPVVEKENFLMNSGLRSGRSSLISYRLNNDILSARQNQQMYRTYSSRSDIDDLTSRETVRDGIGEMSVINEMGKRYTYGLPVYSRNEKDLQYGLQGVNLATQVENNYLVYHKDNKTLFGEERQHPYATTFLLTEVTTPDYVDRSMDGPTVDDFGGYTKFSYKKKYGFKADKDGGSNEWYQWRVPYNGLTYHRNSLSDPKDDLGAVSEGEKEIFYVQTIETKTHLAKFITSEREDSFSASKSAVTNRNAAGSQRLEKLDRIELFRIAERNADGSYSNSDLERIKTIYFDYDYTLMKGMPNATVGAGKLTLKAVRFRYKNFLSSQLTYRMGYRYPNYDTYPEKYQALTSPYRHYQAGSENPGYNKLNTDAWGYYQANGNSRFRRMQEWVNQSPEYPTETTSRRTFDPAAWHLKTVTLPSGGQVHVQYEQDSYSYVQDQAAHVMVPLQAGQTAGNNDKFYLDTEVLGVTTAGYDASDKTHPLNVLKKQVEDRYRSGKHKMYFKFLYRLIGTGTPQLNNCNAEYITGYADVTSVGVDTRGVFVVLGGDNTVQEICQDFVVAERRGSIDISGNCGVDGGIPNTGDVNDMIEEMLDKDRVKQVFSGKKQFCKRLNPGLSYLRIPTPLSKAGGGLRVKRLLMFDRGLEGQSVLYGDEYDYHHYDPVTGTVRSSGVATNEPSAIREENALVDYLPRKRQSKLSKIIAGDDKRESEGPLGETILPGASVGYRRVAKRNIHQGKTNPGYVVSKFYTAYDYPVQVRSTDINRKVDYLPLTLGIINKVVNNNWVTQGYSFILNQMHGQLREQTTYDGDYVATYQLDDAPVSSSTQYHYYEPGETIAVMDQVGQSVSYEHPGKEVDITYAQKAIIDELVDGNVEGDASLGIAGLFPIPFVTGMPSLTSVDTRLYMHLTSKVVRYPALLKRVENYQDGIWHKTENLAFDRNTGRVVVTKTEDDYQGAYLNLQVPAAWQYPGMQAKAKNEGRFVQEEATMTKEGNRFRLRFTGESAQNACQWLEYFSEGDVVSINDEDDLVYHVAEVDASSDGLTLLPTRNSRTPSTIDVENIRVLRSGRDNKLDAPAGQITFHDERAANVSLAMVGIDEETYLDNNFTRDLTSRVKGSVGDEGTFTLSGTYVGFNASAYADLANQACGGVNLSQAEVKNVAFAYRRKVDQNQLVLKLTALDIKCNDGTWKTLTYE